MDIFQEWIGLIIVGFVACQAISHKGAYLLVEAYKLHTEERAAVHFFTTFLAPLIAITILAVLAMYYLFIMLAYVSLGTVSLARRLRKPKMKQKFTDFRNGARRHRRGDAYARAGYRRYCKTCFCGETPHCPIAHACKEPVWGQKLPKAQVFGS